MNCSYLNHQDCKIFQFKLHFSNGILSPIHLIRSSEASLKIKFYLLGKVSSHDKTCSDGWEPKILDGMSLGTKRYDQVLKLRHYAVKQKILDTSSYELWKKNTLTGLQNKILVFIITGKKLSDMFQWNSAPCLPTTSLWQSRGCPILLKDLTCCIGLGGNGSPTECWGICCWAIRPN